MKQTARIISIYASDTAGVSSMLYELGGLTVIHDASGCNSTYSTHDEPRWYNRKSMIYISALTESDMIFGNDDKLIGDVCKTAKELSPRFITLCGSPMPMMVGTDFEAIADEISRKTNLPVLNVRTNGIRSYIKGASDALAAYLRKFCTGAVEKSRDLTCNILGATPLDLSTNGTAQEIRKWLETNGIRVISEMCMDSSPEEIARAGEANVNLVISSAGTGAAEYLKETFDTPWITGLPVGRKFPEKLLAALHSGEEFFTEKSSDGETAVLAEMVAAHSIACAAELDFGTPCRVLVPEILTMGKILPGTVLLKNEEDAAREFAQAERVIADPLYKPVCPQKIPFYSYPHEAFSGRCFRSEIPNWIGRTLERRFFLC